MSGWRLIAPALALSVLLIVLMQPWTAPSDVIAPIDVPASPTAKPADAAADAGTVSTRTSPVAPAPAGPVTTANTQALPELLQRPPEPSGPVADWAELPIAPNLAAWRAMAERDPEHARQLAASLRRCASTRRDTREQILEEWAHHEAHSLTLAGEPSQGQQYLETWSLNYRYRLQAIEHCAGVENPIGEYLKWLERAGRGLPDSERRQRLRLDFVERAFDDMRSAADRISRVDEVIRRRDLARAWLEQLRDAGMLRAIDAYAAAMNGWKGLYDKDTVEYLAWNYVREMSYAADEAQRAASMGWSPPQRGPSAAEQWSEGIQPSPIANASPEQRLEATRRGREYYLRVFGAPPP